MTSVFKAVSEVRALALYSTQPHISPRFTLATFPIREPWFQWFCYPNISDSRFYNCLIKLHQPFLAQHCFQALFHSQG